MGGPQFSHSLDRVEIFTRRLVSSNPETVMDAAGVPFRAGMVSSLFVHGRCCVVGLETSRIFWGESRSGSVRSSADSQWNVVVDILRHAKAGIGVCGDTDVVVDDTHDNDSLLAGEFYFRYLVHTLPCMGIIRHTLELLYLAVE
jgi:hypothetical protein